MFLKRRVAALAAVIATFALGVPVASVSADTVPSSVPIVADYNCAVGLNNTVSCGQLWAVDPPVRNFHH
jgi:hypothetical protein